MLKKTLLILAMTLLGLGCGKLTSQKYLIILQAGTESHEGMARAVHALLYATELKEAGYEVALVFDGAGTEWANGSSKGTFPLCYENLLLPYSS